MVTTNARSTLDPIMDVTDKLPATTPKKCDIDDPRPESAFGLRFAVPPPRFGEHGKTYYTVKVNEPTTISRDGVVETITDSMDREKED